MTVLRVVGLVDTWRFLESCASGEIKAPSPFPVPCPMHLFCLAIPELYLFIINSNLVSKWVS